MVQKQQSTSMAPWLCSQRVPIALVNLRGGSRLGATPRKPIGNCIWGRLISLEALRPNVGPRKLQNLRRQANNLAGGSPGEDFLAGRIETPRSQGIDEELKRPGEDFLAGWIETCIVGCTPLCRRRPGEDFLAGWIETGMMMMMRGRACGPGEDFLAGWIETAA